MHLVAYGFLFISLLRDCVSFRKAGDSEVLTVKSSNFDQKIPSDKFALVLFFAPWQESCDTSHDVLEEIAQQYRDNQEVVVAKGNIYEDGKLASRFDVEDYCKIKYFVKGSRVAEGYEGEHTFTDISRLIQSKVRINHAKDFPRQPLIQLDDQNFDRIVKDTTKDVLVFYYTEWCVKCKNLTHVVSRVADTFKNERKCLVAMLDGEKSFDSAVKSKVGMYPTFVFFPKDDKDGRVLLPGKFDENWSEQNLTKFLNINCDTSRTAGGFLDTTVGRFDELDVIAKYFMRNSHKREKAIRETIEAVQKLPPYKKPIGDYYVKVMRKIMNDGEDFVADEISRLQKLIFGSVSLNIKDEMTKRRNILHHFNKYRRDEL